MPPPHWGARELVVNKLLTSSAELWIEMISAELPMSTMTSPCPTSAALRNREVFVQDRDLGDEADWASEAPYAAPAMSFRTVAVRPEPAERLHQTAFTQDRDSGDETAHVL